MKYTILDEYFKTKKEADNFLMELVNGYEKKEGSQFLLQKTEYLNQILDYCYEFYLSSDKKWVERKKLTVRPTDWYIFFHHEGNISIGHKSPLHPVPMPIDRRKAFTCFGAGKESKEANLREAVRNEISHQIRQAVDATKEVNICFYCEKEFENLEGDHLYPHKQLWPEFCKEFMINEQDVKIKKKPFNNFYGWCFSEETLSKQWQEFHFSRMIILPACRDCNQTKANTMERRKSA